MSSTVGTSPSPTIAKTPKNSKEMTGKGYGSTELCLAYTKGKTYSEEFNGK